MRPNAAERSDSDAVLNARNRIALIKGSLGTRHPEFASALNQLALLLIMQGNADAAEPLLREALDVRRETLGENHPDFATNLSSLGGVLWARGQLDEAEPLLEKAAEVRCATLGPGHPKSVVSLNSLDQLRKARRDWRVSNPIAERQNAIPPAVDSDTVAIRVGVGPPETLAPPVLLAPPASTQEPVVVVADRVAVSEEILTDKIADDLESLRERFASLAQLFNNTARALMREGVVAPDSLEQPTLDARQRYSALQSSVIDAHRELGLAVPSEDLGGLEAIAALLPALREAEVSRNASKGIRARSIKVLDRVGRLTCPASPEFEPLARCRQSSQSLRDELFSAVTAEPSEAAKGLAEGDHPYSALLSLVEAGHAATDAEWADWYESVESAFGHALAVAAARSRLSEPAGSH